MTPDKCDLPWTKGGKELLTLIKREIRKAGGRVKLRHQLIQESREWFGHKEIADANDRLSKLLSKQRERENTTVSDRMWTPEDIEYVVAKYGRIKTGKIAMWLKRTAPSIKQVFYAYADERTKLWVKNFGIDAHRFNNLKNIPNASKHEKEIINNSQAQKNQAHRQRPQTGVLHFPNL